MATKPFEIDTLKVDNDSGQVLGGGTSAQRGAAPEEKTVRVNTDIENLELFVNGAWVSIGDKEVKLKAAVTANQSTELGSMYPIDTSISDYTLPFPASPATGDIFSGFDQKGTWDTNALTLVPNGDLVEGGTANVIRNVKGGYFRYVFSGPDQGWIDINKIPKTYGIITTWVAVTTAAAVTALPNTGYYVYTDTIGADATINLPASPAAFDQVRIVDRQGKASQFKINVVRNGKRINNETEHDVIDGDYQLREYTYYGVANSLDSWVITADNSGGGKYKALATEDLDALAPGQYVQNTDSDATLARHYPEADFVGTVVYAGNYQFANHANGTRFIRENASGWQAWSESSGGLKVNGTTLANGTHAVEVGTIYPVNSTAGGVTLTLPTTDLEIGDEIGFVDAAGQLGINPVVMNAGANQVLGASAYSFYGTGRSASVFWTGTAWVSRTDTHSNGSLGSISRGLVTGTTNAATPGDLLRIDTSGGVATAQLPANPQPGDTVWFIDVTGSFATNNFTIERGDPTHRIMKDLDDLIMEFDYQVLALMWVDNAAMGWQAISGTHLGGAILEGAGGGLEANPTVVDHTAVTTLDANTMNFIDTSGGMGFVSLPGSPTIGDRCGLIDYAGTFGTNQVSIFGNGAPIQRVPGGSHELKYDNQVIVYIYSGPANGWLIEGGTHLGGGSARSANVNNAATTGSLTPDMRGDIEAIVMTVSQATTINGLIYDAGVTKPFLIVLEDDGGSHPVTLDPALGIRDGIYDASAGSVNYISGFITTKGVVAMLI